MTNLAVDRTTPPHLRRRAMISLFTAVSLQTIGIVGASTAATLISAEIAGPGASGLPNAAVVLGTAAGGLGVGRLMARSGRRFALLTTYTAGTAGALLAFAGALGRALPLVVLGMLLLGIQQGGALLSRYVAAELYPASRKGFGLSVIVWSGTVGAVFGPALLAPAARAAAWQGWPGLAGPVAVCALAAAAALLTTMLIPGAAFAVSDGPAGQRRRAVDVRAAFRLPAVRLSTVAMAAAHVSMVSLMLMTPVQLDHHGHGLHVVGFILSAHMIGMFALAPLSGRIADKLGGPATVGAGVAVLLAAAAVAALLPTSHDLGLPIALFLLGYGWNLAFVGGSSVLSRDLPEDTRIQLQGLIDAIIWGSSAIASLSAGPLFGVGGYPLLALLAGLIAMVPLALLARR
jgi:MFS family permease